LFGLGVVSFADFSRLQRQNFVIAGFGFYFEVSMSIYRMNHTEFKCPCPVGSPGLCCMTLFEAIGCHLGCQGFVQKAAKKGLTGVTSQGYINGKPGVDDFASGRDSAGAVLTILSERAVDFLRHYKIELSNLVDFDQKELARR
jgi:hypothetical protein